MAKAITDPRKRRGRPTLYEGSEGKGAPQVAVRFPPLTLAAIDGWIARQKVSLSRPEAIRRLVEQALEGAKKGGRVRPMLLKNRINPHPGRILLEEFMTPLGLTGNALALALRVPPSRINGIINGGRAVSADTALRLARYFDTSPEFWLNIQAGHDLSLAQAENGKKIEAEVIAQADGRHGRRGLT